MILEAAPLQIRPGHSAEFEASFREAEGIIALMPGYISHELHHYYDPFPIVLHDEAVAGSEST